MLTAVSRAGYFRAQTPPAFAATQNRQAPVVTSDNRQDALAFSSNRNPVRFAGTAVVVPATVRPKLHEAIREGDLERVGALLDTFQDNPGELIRLVAESWEGHSALQMAARSQRRLRLFPFILRKFELRNRLGILTDPVMRDVMASRDIELVRILRDFIPENRKAGYDGLTMRSAAETGDIGWIVKVLALVPPEGREKAIGTALPTLMRFAVEAAEDSDKLDKILTSAGGEVRGPDSEPLDQMGKALAVSDLVLDLVPEALHEEAIDAALKVIQHRKDRESDLYRGVYNDLVQRLF